MSLTTETSANIQSFEVGGTTFGLMVEHVREIIRQVPINSLSNAPPCVLGMIDLRGEVIPVVDLAVLFGANEACTLNERTCFVIALPERSEGASTPLALVVDRVCGLLAASKDQIHPPPAFGDQPEAEYVAGVIQPSPQQPSVVMLDLPKLLAIGDVFSSGLVASTGLTGTDAAWQGKSTLSSRVSDAKTHKVLCVHLGRETYGVRLNDIDRIVPTESITPDHLAPACVKGVMHYQDRQLAVLDLADVLHVDRESANNSKKSCVVVLREGEVEIGFRLDELGPVVTVPESELEKGHSIEDIGGTGLHGAGVIHLEDKVVEVLRLATVIDSHQKDAIRCWRQTAEVLNRIAAHDGSAKPEAERQISEAHRALEGPYLLVRVGPELMGLPVQHLERVVVPDSVTHIPLARADADGLLTVRGEPVPMMNLARHFDFAPLDPPPVRQRVVIVKDHSRHVGLVVDDTLRLESFRVAQLSTSATTDCRIHRDLVNGTAETNGESVCLLNVPKLIDDKRKSLVRQLQELNSSAGTAT